MTDSRIETYRHIQEVQRLMTWAVGNLLRRMQEHDQSKLVSLEVEAFDEFTEKLRSSTYGSPEYEEFRRAMKPSLDHHYAHNRHHPEYHRQGIKGMTLLDLVEMLCDWMAAVKRHSDGDISKSIEINQKRFGYSDELKQILVNTVEEMIGS